jgi:hypothetical protein
MAKAAVKKKPEFRHNCSYVWNGEKRFGVIAFDKAKPGNVFIDDAVLPFRVEVLDDDNVVDIPHSLTSKTDFPVYDRDTGLLVSGGNDFDRFVSNAYTQAQAASKAAGKGVAVNKLFSIGVADGKAVYVVTKIRGDRVTVEWRGFGGGDRYTDHYFGYGKTVSKADVAKYIRGEEGMAAVFASIDERDRAVITSQPVGAILHYVGGRGEKWPTFQRFEVIEQDGEKVARFLGVCGTFTDHYLPRRNCIGHVVMDSDLQRLLKDPIRKKLCASYVYETEPGDTLDLKRSKLPDPRTLPLADITIPEPTAEQTECARLNDVLQAVRNACNGQDQAEEGYDSAVARKRLVRAWKLLQAECGD